MFTSFQAKTYQQIADLFSPRSAATAANGTDFGKEMNTKTHGEEGAIGKYSVAPIVKNSLDIECQGKKYAYHLGEVLKRKWELPDTKSANKVSRGGGHGGLWMKLLGGGGGPGEGGVDGQMAKREFTVRFCLFGVNTDAITPFLEFWLVPNAENVLAFPETVFEAMDSGLDGGEGDSEEEEQHAAFLDVCRKKFVELGIAGGQDEEAGEAYTTERMERDYHGYVFGPGEEDRVVYVFFQLLPGGEGAIGKLAILDEMLNRHKVLEMPVDAKMRDLFYNYPELLYIYGSPMSPIDSVVFGEDSEYDATEEAPQEIPYCLYLCQDKAKLTEEAQEGKAVETPTGNALPGIEEPHYVSPKDKYQLTPGKTDLEHLRTEDKYGYFYYFTHELMGDEDVKLVKRYAVFTYNTDYRLDEETKALLKSLELDKLMKGGSHLKRELESRDWVYGGDGKERAEQVEFYYAPSTEIRKGDDVIVAKKFVEEIYVKRPNTPVPEEESESESEDLEMEMEQPVKRKALDINPEPMEEVAVEDSVEPERTKDSEEEPVEDSEEREEEPVEEPAEETEEDLEEKEEEPVETTEPEKDQDLVEGAVEDIPLPLEKPASEDLEEEEEDTENTEYASVYFQRDEVPLWCIKHRICFTCLDSDSVSPPPLPESETVEEEEPIKIEK